MKVSEKVCIELQKAIFKGEYPPHSRFPSERELAAHYDVSRSAVREAVAKLTQLGLVETRPQSGTYVSNYQTDGSLDLLVHIMHAGEAIDHEVMTGLLKMRRITEPFIAREAALQATPEDVDALRTAGDNLIAAIRYTPTSPPQLSESDFTFHATLTKASHNLIFQLFFNSFKPIYKFYTDYYYATSATHTVTITFVQKLVQAVAEKDENGAENILRETILFAEEHVNAGLSRENR